MITFASLHRLVGNTPLLAIDFRYRGEPRTIYAKHESLNLTGSIKDRMALYILERAYREGRIRARRSHRRGHQRQHRHLVRGDRPRARPSGHDLHARLDERERMALIASFGADVVPVSRAEGGFLGSIDRAEAQGPPTPRVFLPRQFSNEANVARTSRRPGPRSGGSCAARASRPRRSSPASAPAARSWASGRYLRTLPPVDPRPSARAGRVADALDRPQGRPASHPGHLRRVRPADRPARGARRGRSQCHDGDAILMAQTLARARPRRRHLVGRQLHRRDQGADGARAATRRRHGVRRQQQEVPQHRSAAARAGASGVRDAARGDPGLHRALAHVRLLRTVSVPSLAAGGWIGSRACRSRDIGELGLAVSVRESRAAIIAHMETSSLTRKGSLDRAIARARDALHDFPACFWTRAPHAPIETREDVVLVVRRLRQQGSAQAWRAAAEIERCL